jgi:hydroxyacylglutathione hydrolase
MSFEILSFVLGPVVTNAYIIGDNESMTATVIDPAWDGEVILAAAQNKGWKITNIWLTHAHFDHLGGCEVVANGLNPIPPVALHADDIWLWEKGGGGKKYGLNIDPGPKPTIDLVDGMELFLGKNKFDVLFAPGHTPGHVMFYNAAQSVLFCGDVIFRNSIGRTDLEGGDYKTLIESIHTKVFTLPNDTKLLNGHGLESTIGYEKLNNPFLK